MTSAFKFRVLKRGTNFATTIIAIYRKNAKDGEAPLWIGQRKDSNKFRNVAR
jgi:hypothetical protein